MCFVHYETFGFQHGGQAAAHAGVVVRNQYAVVNRSLGLWLRSGNRRRLAGEGCLVLKVSAPFPRRRGVRRRAVAKFPATIVMADKIGRPGGSDYFACVARPTCDVQTLTLCSVWPRVRPTRCMESHIVGLVCCLIGGTRFSGVSSD